MGAAVVTFCKCDSGKTKSEWVRGYKRARGNCERLEKKKLKSWNGKSEYNHVRIEVGDEWVSRLASNRAINGIAWLHLLVEGYHEANSIADKKRAPRQRQYSNEYLCSLFKLTNYALSFIFYKSFWSYGYLVWSALPLLLQASTGNLSQGFFHQFSWGSWPRPHPHK